MDTIKINSKNVKMIAHRGVSGLERENTYPAFVAAGNRSYFGIETDVHVTKDKKFVIIHDETTKRISLEKQNINVEENEYSILKNIVLLDLDGRVGRNDLRIPLLRDYLDICIKYDKYCVLELKNPFLEKDIISMLQEIEDADYIGKVIFISFDLQNCIILRKHLPKSEIQWLIGSETITKEKIEILVNNRLYLDVYYKVLNKKLVDTLHEKGILVNCWTCDNKEHAEHLIDMGVDYITSNILE